jgi:hypothetical protein
MLDEAGIRAVAQSIIDQSKSSARVDTGALKRSISFTYVKEQVIFRMLYYGQFGKNSKLEANARRLMPSGVKWKIIYTEFGGGTYEVGVTQTGRNSTRKIIDSITRSSTTAVTSLLNRIRGKKKD